MAPRLAPLSAAMHESPPSPDAGGIDFRLLNEFQHDFPLVPRPFASMAERLGCSDDEVLKRLRRLSASGTISRIGPVFAPRALGASTLAALAAPPRRLSELAHRVSVYPHVNHNYEREHRLNLWFVVTAADRRELSAVLHGIERDTAYAVLALPLLEEYHIDLGFDLRGGAKRCTAPRRVSRTTAPALPKTERSLAVAMQGGLALVGRPFAAPAQRAGISEAGALQIVEGWLGRGVLKRFGVVVRHRELGYVANAMCVWDIPDRKIRLIGPLLAREPGVTLCYRRRRALPDWPYNLYCMIHGRERREVEERIAAIEARLELTEFRSAVLFSRRRFKQRGACYGAAAEVEHGRQRSQDHQYAAG